MDSISYFPPLWEPGSLADDAPIWDLTTRPPPVLFQSTLAFAAPVPEIQCSQEDRLFAAAIHVPQGARIIKRCGASCSRVSQGARYCKQTCLPCFVCFSDVLAANPPRCWLQLAWCQAKRPRQAEGLGPGSGLTTIGPSKREFGCRVLQSMNASSRGLW